MDQITATNISKVINDLNIKYKESPYMLQRLQTHLNNFPNILDNENKKREEKLTRINALSLEQETFFKVFLSKHQYFYMPYNSIYYEYDGKTYKIVKEDDIHHKLLTTITNEGKLVQWKHKTKQNIIKQIKERILIKSTPDTYTIQNVLSFLQNIFPSKTEAKYFLTVIGDCLLKKNANSILYFVSSNIKKIISLIDSVGYVTTGTSIVPNFVTKYHESHQINQYRLIKANENSNTFSYDINKTIINQLGVDLICVAAHYSERYSNAECYLAAKVDDVLRNKILYFNQNSLDKIVDQFVSQCIEKGPLNTNINWKNMHYIWKLYLFGLDIPNMIYSSQLQSLLLAKIENTNENGNILFLNVCSSYLPSVSSFLSFWDKHITITNETAEDEYEIDELVTLYKQSEQKVVNISDTNMIKMIHHYFSPLVEIIENKYVINIKCNLWIKCEDINDFLKQFKVGKKDVAQSLISLDDMYQEYKIFVNANGIIEKKATLIVSKQFFEKYITNKLAAYIEFDKFVSSEWLQSE